MSKNILGILSFLLIGLWSCSDDNSGSSPKPGDPSNLEVDITIPDQNAGDVEITATADNAVLFEFDLGDGSNIVSNNTGKVSHTYELTGTYDLEVKVFGTSGRFLKKLIPITVMIGDDELGINPEGYTTPLTYDNMTLVWNDEFEGDALNTSDWSYDIGDGCDQGICGWGNSELQYYKSENLSVEDGYLIIQAKEESIGGKNYTSSRILTKGKQSFQFGRVDIRATLPKGKGMWPAAWMLGANIDAVGWPWCGEIDIMEMAGGNDDVSIGNIFWENGNGTSAANFPGYSQLSSGIYADEFHVFSIVWNSSGVVWYRDDVQFHAININTAEFDEFRNEFYFLLNLAVGGSLPGSPDASTRFPQRYVVDYIRIFQNN